MKMSSKKTEQQILKNLSWNETLIIISNEDILLVERNTKGNLLPAHKQTNNDR